MNLYRNPVTMVTQKAESFQWPCDIGMPMQQSNDFRMPTRGRLRPRLAHTSHRKDLNDRRTGIRSPLSTEMAARW
jgi:hypothetical protein